MLLHEVAKHVLQNATVAVVVRFTRRVDANNCVELDDVAVFLGCGDLDGLRGLAIVQGGDALNVERFRAVQAQ